jgi:hypothetical protein
MSRLNSTIKRPLLIGTVPVSCGPVAIEFVMKGARDSNGLCWLDEDGDGDPYIDTWLAAMHS